MSQPPPKCKRCGTDKKHRLEIHDEWLCAGCIEAALEQPCKACERVLIQVNSACDRCPEKNQCTYADDDGSCECEIAKIRAAITGSVGGRLEFHQRADLGRIDKLVCHAMMGERTKIMGDILWEVRVAVAAPDEPPDRSIAECGEEWKRGDDAK